MASALVLVMFSYSGWNAAAYIAEEIRDPARNLPRSLLLGTALVTILYVGVNLAYLTVLPLDRLQGEVAVAQLAAAAVLPSGEWIVTLLILVSILSSVTAMSIAGPRIYFAMSRERLFPSWLGEVHLRKKIPLKAIWFQSGIALALVWMGTLRQILLFSGIRGHPLLGSDGLGAAPIACRRRLEPRSLDPAAVFALGLRLDESHHPGQRGTLPSWRIPGRRGHGLRRAARLLLLPAARRLRDVTIPGSSRSWARNGRRARSGGGSCPPPWSTGAASARFPDHPRE